jgi:hypothetical protein
MSSKGKPKLETLARMARDINAQVALKAMPIEVHRT